MGPHSTPGEAGVVSATAEFVRYLIATRENMRGSLKGLHQRMENDRCIREYKARLLVLEAEERRETGPLFTHAERDAAD